MARAKTGTTTAKAIQQRLLRAFHEDVEVNGPFRIVVGFSGGNDSLALALLLKRIQPATSASIVLAHVDHRTRPESGDDAARAESLAREIGLPFVLLTAVDHPQTLHPRRSLEEAARIVRYELLNSLLRAPGDVLALAHHADDQVETVLLNLLRGAGTDGLRGMQRCRRVAWHEEEAVDSPQSVLWRPLLAESRSDLEAIVNDVGLTPIHDPSNDDTDLRRNAIRHKLIPEIAAIEPAYRDRFRDLTEIAREDSRYLDVLAAELSNELIDVDGTLKFRELPQHPAAMQRRVVREWLRRGTGEVPSFDRVEAVLQLAASGSQSAIVEVERDLVVAADHDRLYCGRLDEMADQVAMRLGLALPPIGSPRKYRINGDTIRIEGGDSRRVIRGFAIAPSATLGVEVAPRSDFAEVLRRHYMPAWMRDRVRGVAFDGVVQWIPFFSPDQEEPGSGDPESRMITIETVESIAGDIPER